jgi:acyl-CoA-binding protein
MTEERFKKAVYMIRNGPPKESTDAEKLKVYSLFKQATEG